MAFQTVFLRNDFGFALVDYLMARITPCLENGKTAMVNILKSEEVGLDRLFNKRFRRLKDRVLFAIAMLTTSF